MQGALGRSLYTLHLSHLSPTLARFLSLFAVNYENFSQFGKPNLSSLPSFSLTLPPVWGIPLAWSLSALPLLPLLVGLLVHLILAGGQIAINLPSTFSSIIPLDTIYLSDTFICIVYTNIKLFMH